jgi:WD40 repeat protein
MPVKIFICYAREDESLLKQLKKQLTPLQRRGLIDVWDDRDIDAGTEWEKEIKEHLDAAQIILLLVSPDFMDSDYCYGKEMKQALERHHRKEARVIPVILRPVYWEDILGNIQVLPRDTIPVQSWRTADEAFYDVAKGIREIVLRYNQTSDLTADVPSPVRVMPPIQISQHFQHMRPLSPKLHRILEGHTSAILRITWSPDGRLLASTGVDKTIRLWNTEIGEEIRTLTGHSSGVNQVAWSPKGDVFASCSNDHSMRIWETSTGKLLWDLEHAHLGDIPSIAWSPDGQILASGSSDSTIKLWQINDKRGLQFLRMLEEHKDGVQYVAWSPDGTKLASCAGDATIRIWDSISWRTLRTLRGHEQGIICIAWSPDNNILASASHDTTVRIWDINQDEPLQTFGGPKIYVRSVSFSCDGRLLASNSPEILHRQGETSEGKVRIRRTDTWEEIAVLPELIAWWWVPGLAFHPNNPDMLATLGNYDRDVHIWDLRQS